MKVIFAGTPEFAVAPLRAIAQQHDIVGVFTQADAKTGRGRKLTPPMVKQVALELGLQVYQPSELDSQIDLLKSLQADVMVVVAYGILLSPAVLDIPRLGCLNIHASILPRWRGAAPIHRAIAAGDTQTGVSIMQMDAGLDTGAVYHRLSTDIHATDTTPTLHTRLSQLGATAIIDTLQLLADDPAYPAVAQADLKPALSPSYAKKIVKAEAEIDWHDSAQTIERRIRALLPWPVCQTHFVASDKTTKRIRILAAHVREQSSNTAQAGEIIALDAAGIHVQCGAGVLLIERCQRDGSAVLAAKEFLNGMALVVGQRFAPPC